MADVTAAPAADGAGHEQNGPGGDGGNKFQHAISSWRSMLPTPRLPRSVPEIADWSGVDIDLTSLISNLDNSASEIVAYQRDSTVQRKDLAQKTKDFRKLDDAAKLGEVKGLLKGQR